MVTRADYSAEAVEACRSVLIELTHALAVYGDEIVVVGGWVPVLLFPDATEPHPGTLDLDLAIDFRRVTEDRYQTILSALTTRGYAQDPDQPFQFFRRVRLPGRGEVTVRVDLLAGEYGGTGSTHRTQRLQEVKLRKARGCDLAFLDAVKVSAAGVLPDGGHDEVVVRVAGVVPWIVMKGMALHDRMKEKDAFDLYYVVRNSPGGSRALAVAFQPYLENGLVREALAKIRTKFGRPDSVGPRWVADFLEATDPEVRDIRVRDAFETINALLDLLKVPPHKS